MCLVVSGTDVGECPTLCRRTPSAFRPWPRLVVIELILLRFIELPSAELVAVGMVTCCSIVVGTGSLGITTETLLFWELGSITALASFVVR